MTMTSILQTSALLELLNQYPKPQDTTFTYGTAGFRCSANLLHSTFLRVGCLAALLSHAERLSSTSSQWNQNTNTSNSDTNNTIDNNNNAVGVMCTASHNPDSDNGVKIVDVNGGMMRYTWESIATELTNIESANEVISYLQSICTKFNITATSDISSSSTVYVGYDSRIHSIPFAQLVTFGAKCCGARVVCIGCVTTPIVHHCVYQANGLFHQEVVPCLPDTFRERNWSAIARKGTVDAYLDILCLAYIEMLRTCTASPLRQASNIDHPRLVVDCACGVGAPFIERINSRLASYRATLGAVELITVNGIGEGPLNNTCGAEYVQKQKLPPQIFSRIKMYDQHLDHATYPEPAEEENINLPNRNASLDGDADRIVFHRYDKSNRFRLLDGDKIASLIALFVQSQVLILKPVSPELINSIRCGVVQTAYANGASSQFLKKKMMIEVAMAKTGVKFVHAAAHDNFDVGIYFEANGHGTVLFSSRYYKFLNKCSSLLSRSDVVVSEEQKAALKRLQLMPALVNQAIGDAFSDLLLVEAILHIKRHESEKHWSNDFGVWDNLYDELPSRQLKVKVMDRNTVKTNNDETKTVSPPTLQPALEAAMNFMNRQSKTHVARVFVRPSGTEDAVRIYAEAKSIHEANSLAAEAKTIVQKICSNDFSNITPQLVSKI